jgi:glycosyltransferase involved in cell wall biosynthesis
MSELIVHWDGNLLGPYSLDIVNREIIGRIHGRHGIRVATLPRDGEITFAPYRNIPHLRPEEFGGGADIVIRHRWPPTFQRAGEDYYIHGQPWEYGALPVSWRDALRQEADEIWCYSNAVREVYLDAGFAPERVTVLPLGFDQNLFFPAPVTNAELPTERSCVFLFVGGLLGRKGFDILMETYQRTFTNRDDVALIIKAVGSKDIYRTDTEGLLRRIAEIPNLPEVVFYETHLGDPALADLYRLSTALVHPYRGEGFGLPALEAGACGTPAVYTEGGAIDDFLNDEIAYPLPSLRAAQPVANDDALGPYCGTPWVLDPNRDALAATMRAIAADPQAAKARGACAAATLSKAWTWDQAAEKFARHLLAIKERRSVSGDAFCAHGRKMRS